MNLIIRAKINLEINRILGIYCRMQSDICQFANSFVTLQSETLW